MRISLFAITVFLSGYMVGKIRMLFRMMLLKQENQALKTVRETERIQGFLEGIRDSSDYDF